MKYHGPHSAPTLELFACSRLKLGNSIHRRAETISFLNVFPPSLVERVVHVRGRQDHFQHLPAPKVLTTPYSLEVGELHEWRVPASNGKQQVTARERAVKILVKHKRLQSHDKPRRRPRMGNSIAATCTSQLVYLVHAHRIVTGSTNN